MKIKLSLLLGIILLMMAGCKKDKDSDSSKSKYFFPDTWYVPAGVDTIEVYINVFDNWSITSPLDWARPEKFEGEGNDTVRIFISANPYIKKRFGAIKFYYSTTTPIPDLEITQAGNGYLLNLQTDSLSTGAEGEVWSTRQVRTVAWEFKDVPSWIAPLTYDPSTPFEGWVDTTEFKVQILPNTEYNFRIGKVLMQQKEEPYTATDTLTVFQDGIGSRATDSLMLVALYNSCGGDRWTTKWNLSEPMTKWNGVTLRKVPEATGPKERVVSLFLADNNLSGTIPAEIGNISYLETLRLNKNDLTGGIPASIGNLQKLKVLWLDNNPSLGGTLPESVGNLTGLKELIIFNAGLTGSIPASLSNLIYLTSLNLSGNDLTGTLPEALGTLENIRYFIVRNNQLGGAIPATYLNNYMWPYWNVKENICPQQGTGFTNCPK